MAFGWSLCLDEGPSHLLKKKRDAIAPIHDLLDEALRQQVSVWQRIYHFLALTLADAIQHQRRDMRLIRPCHADPGARGDQQQDRQGLYPVDEPVEKFERRRVAPVQVLEDENRGAFGAGVFHEARKHIKGSLRLLSRIEARRPLSSILRY